MLCVTADALAVHAARRALVATLCSNLDKTSITQRIHDLDKFGGATKLVALLKLVVASERALSLGQAGDKLTNTDTDLDGSNSDGMGDANSADSPEHGMGAGMDAVDAADAADAAADAAVGTGSSLVGALCNVIKQLLQAEAETQTKPSTVPLSKVLVDDCVQNLTKATRPTASSERKVHWLQVDLGEEAELTGVAVQGVIGGFCEARGGHVPASLTTGFILRVSLDAREWRPLCAPGSDQPFVFDGTCMDATGATNLGRIENAVEEDNATQDDFEANFGVLKFCTPGSDGKIVELKPGGGSFAVTMANRAEYCRLVESYRLHEFDRQTSAIRRGLSTVVPMSILQLFTWQEVEALVAGRPGVDIEYLKKHTDYRGFDASSSVIGWFWEAMESFSSEDRTMFIRFVWGRNRLPPPGQPWPQRFTIDRGPDGDTQLPEAHTCFFSIDLPRYTSARVMRDRLLTAIHFGVGGILNG
eukprot:g982.t1